MFMGSEKKKSALTAGIGYTIGNILIKGINFLTLPLFSRLMTQDEFGVFNVFMSYDAILFVIVGLALHTSIRNANLEFPGKIDSYTSSITLIYLLMAALFSMLVLLFGETLAQLLAFEEKVLYMLIIYSAGSSLLLLYNTRISLDYSYKKYLLVSMINSVGNVALSLVLILTVFRQDRAYGRIVGVTTVITLLTVCLLIAMYRKARPRFNGAYWRFGLKFSLPIVPHGVSQVLLAQFDRIMIRNMVSDAAAGIYSLAANIKLILIVITTSISEAWSTWFYSRMENQERGLIRTRATQLCCMFTILTVGLIAISPEMVLILGGRAYDSAKYVAIPMILDSFILFLFDVIATGEYYSKKTVYIMLGTMAAAVLNIVLNYVFILKYGFLAAAYTTLFAYVCYLLLHLVISRQLIGFWILPIRWFLTFSAISAGMAAVSLLLVDRLLLRWSICAALVIPMAILLLRSMKQAEKS